MIEAEFFRLQTCVVVVGLLHTLTVIIFSVIWVFDLRSNGRNADETWDIASEIFECANHCTFSSCPLDIMYVGATVPFLLSTLVLTYSRQPLKPQAIQLGLSGFGAVILAIYSALKIIAILIPSHMESVCGMPWLRSVLLNVLGITMGAVTFVFVVYEAFLLRRFRQPRGAYQLLETVTSSAGEDRDPALDHAERVFERFIEDERKRAKPSRAKRLMRLCVIEWRMTTLGLTALAASSVTSLIMPYFFGRIIDAVGGDGQQVNRSHLNYAVLLIIVVSSLNALYSLIRAWLFGLVGIRAISVLRTSVFKSIMGQNIAFFDKSRTGELTSRLSTDTQALQGVLTNSLPQFVRFAVQIIGSLVILFATSWKLTLLMLSVVPLVSIGSVSYGKFLRRQRKAFQDHLAEASAKAEETVSNVRTVRTFGAEMRECGMYAHEIDNSYARGARLALASGAFPGILGFTGQGAIALVLWYGGTLVVSGELSAGTLTSFVLYTLSMAMNIAFLSSLYGDFMTALGSSARIFEILDMPVGSEQVSEGIRSSMVRVEGHISFQDVRFRYPSRQSEALKGLSFNIKPYTTNALVGASGAGKSTIFALLERFYRIDDGSITIDGSSIYDYDPTSLRQSFGMVLQEPALFGGTIRENIAYSIPDATEDDIVRVAKAANIHDTILTFDDKYDTVVGERGIRLSGGQKQRVAIARALLKDPPVLLLDEATSALDTESEALVQAAIDNMVKDRTVIVIAHRLSTVQNADQVIVIDGGKAVEVGRHAELLEHPDGFYRRLVQRQLEGNRGAQANGKKDE
eukprot:Clim_evm34s88 gene=Clim_evmTU34s88